MQNLAGTERRQGARYSRFGQRLDRVQEVQDRAATSGRDIVRVAGDSALSGADVRGYDIVDINEIARLPSVAVNRRHAAVDGSLNKKRDNGRITGVGALPLT